MKKYLIILALLSGCSSPKVIEVPVIFHVDSVLLVRCPDLTQITDDANMGDLLMYDKDLMQQYTECAMKADSLIEIVKQKVTK